MFRFKATASLLTPLTCVHAGKAQIARNSRLLRTTAGMQEVEQRMEQLPRFATQKLDILDAGSLSGLTDRSEGKPI